MSKARDLADFQGSASALTTGTLPVDRVPYVGRRNLIINGAMQVWQRGISWASLGNGIYTADRWQSFGSGLTCVIDRSTDVPANQGFRYSFKVNRTANGLPILRQPIEDFDILVTNRQVTLSFWAKADSATTVDVDLGDNDGAKATFSLTTTWQYFTHTYEATSAYTYFALDFQANSVTTAMYFTGIQLEHGSVATPFEHRSYGEELALCQRYYYSTLAARGVIGSPTVDHLQIQGTRHQFADVSGYRSQLVSHPVTMRSDPTVTFYSGSSGSAGVMFLYAHNGANQDFSGFTYPKEDNVKFCGYTGVSVGSTGLSTECWVHYEMDAEL